MITIIICIISLIVTGYANSEMDTIQFRPDKAFSKSDFWLNKGKFIPQNRTWFLKNIGSMFSDGWHLMKFIRVFSVCIPFTFLLMEYYKIDLTWYWVVLVNFAPYTLIGSIFEIGYALDEKQWIKRNAAFTLILAVLLFSLVVIFFAMA